MKKREKGMRGREGRGMKKSEFGERKEADAPAGPRYHVPDILKNCSHFFIASMFFVHFFVYFFAGLSPIFVSFSKPLFNVSACDVKSCEYARDCIHTFIWRTFSESANIERSMQSSNSGECAKRDISLWREIRLTAATVDLVPGVETKPCEPCRHTRLYIIN